LFNYSPINVSDDTLSESVSEIILVVYEDYSLLNLTKVYKLIKAVLKYFSLNCQLKPVTITL
jgi:hypothetical protein